MPRRRRRAAEGLGEAQAEAVIGETPGGRRWGDGILGGRGPGALRAGAGAFKRFLPIYRRMARIERPRSLLRGVRDLQLELVDAPGEPGDGAAGGEQHELVQDLRLLFDALDGFLQPVLGEGVDGLVVEDLVGANAEVQKTRGDRDRARSVDRSPDGVAGQQLDRLNHMNTMLQDQNAALRQRSDALDEAANEANEWSRATAVRTARTNSADSCPSTTAADGGRRAR
jgi:hypothetical protein